MDPIPATTMTRRKQSVKLGDIKVTAILYSCLVLSMIQFDYPFPGCAVPYLEISLGVATARQVFRMLGWMYSNDICGGRARPQGPGGNTKHQVHFKLLK